MSRITKYSFRKTCMRFVLEDTEGKVIIPRYKKEAAKWSIVIEMIAIILSVLPERPKRCRNCSMIESILSGRKCVFKNILFYYIQKTDRTQEKKTEVFPL